MALKKSAGEAAEETTKHAARHADTSGRLTTVKGPALTKAVLKKAGGSLVMTVPAPARDALHLVAGMEMAVTVEGDKLVLEPTKPARPKYTLDELLAQCDFDAPLTEEEKAWLNEPPVGRELL